MSELPKIVRDRLAQAPAGPHPDPDLLTAFAEQTLAPRERLQVLAHLGSCAECRQVVVLTTPPQTIAEAPVPAPARGWFAWSYMRWSGAIAAVLVVASIALYFQEQWKQLPAPPAAVQTETAKVESAKPSEGFQDNRKQEAPTRSEQEVRSREQARADAPPASQPAAPPPPAPIVTADKIGEAHAGAIGGGRAAVAASAARDELAAPAVTELEKKEKDEKFDSLAMMTPGKTAEQPRANEVVDVEAEAPMVESTRSEVASVGEKRSADSAKLARQAPAAPAAASTFSVSVAPNWRITAAGALERSREDKWQTALSVPDVRFTTVAALGNNVWAGANGGVVYVTNDNGRRWLRRQISVGGATVAEDVTAIQVLGAGSASVRTASATYTTTDGGATWTLAAQ